MSTSVPYPPEPYPLEPHPPAAASAAEFADAETAADDAALRLAWWVGLGGALISVVFGAMMVAWPEATLQVIAALFGIWLLLHGVVRIVQAITASAREGAERALLGVIGILFVIAGVIALRNLLVSLAVVTTIVGLMWLIGGIAELISAFSRRAGGDRTMHAVLSGLSILGALVVLVWPDLSLVALVYVVGAWMLIMGLIQLGLVVWARRSLPPKQASAL
ncbi:MAG TPA: DUF308 domain-containing protein [Asanoa sp.]